MSITSANAILMINIAGLFATAQQIQGWAADEAFEVETVEATETLMGIDGILSGGFVNAPVPMGITLMADSPSLGFFETWAVQQRLNQDAFTGSGILRLPGLGRKWAMPKGFLRNFMPIPAARKVLQPRRFSIIWESVGPQPI